MNKIQIEFDDDELTEREKRVLMFESFVTCLELFQPEIKKRFESIVGVNGCYVGYGARGFDIQVETAYPELRPSFIIDYKHIYLDMVDNMEPNYQPPLVNSLSRDIVLRMAQVREAISAHIRESDRPFTDQEFVERMLKAGRLRPSKRGDA